jgi:alkyl hydroperoxide reductase subunit AhpF
MALLDDPTRAEVKKALAPMANPVRLIVFTQGKEGALECETCMETRQLAEEVSSLNGKIHLEIRDFLADSALAEKMRIDKIPSMALLAEESPLQDYGIRFYGLPGGFEFSTFIQDLLVASRRNPGLNPTTISKISQIHEPVHIQVFSTPT